MNKFKEYLEQKEFETTKWFSHFDSGDLRLIYNQKPIEIKVIGNYDKLIDTKTNKEIKLPNKVYYPKQDCFDTKEAAEKNYQKLLNRFISFQKQRIEALQKHLDRVKTFV